MSFSQFHHFHCSEENRIKIKKRNYTLGKFAFSNTCMVECHGDSQWRTHLACIGKRKSTHSEEV